MSWTTPTWLYVLLVAAWAATAAMFVSISVGVADSGRALRAVGSDSAPSINDSLDLNRDLSDMDADAVEYVLLGGRAAGASVAAGVLNHYEQRRQAVSSLLVLASRDSAYGTSERTAIQRLVTMTQVFNADVGQAILLTDQDDRAGALAAYGQATDLMHAPFNGMLETASDLAAADHDHMTAAYASASDEAGRDVALVVVSGLLLLGLLAAFQLVLAWRTRRRLNLLSVAASLLALTLLVDAGVRLAANGDLLRAAKPNAYDSVYALRQLQAIAFDARADESRYLVDLADAQRAQLDQASFLDKSLELASFQQPVTLATYDATLDERRVALWNGRPAGLEGAFGRALHMAQRPREDAAAQAALLAYAQFERDDRTLRALARAGSLTEAIRYDTSPVVGDAGGDFNAFATALERWIQIDQRAFEDAIATGGGNLRDANLYPLVALLVAGLPAAGAWARLREFEGWGA